MEKAKKERKQKLSLRFFLARTVIENFKKNRKNIQEIKKHLYGLILSQNRLEKDEKGKKSKVPFRFVLTRRVIENSKTIAKKFKKLKNSFMASLQAKIGWKRLRKRENKNYRFVSSLPGP